LIIFNLGLLVSNSKELRLSGPKAEKNVSNHQEVEEGHKIKARKIRHELHESKFKKPEREKKGEPN
jgi:hypothetical protein